MTDAGLPQVQEQFLGRLRQVGGDVARAMAERQVSAGALKSMLESKAFCAALDDAVDVHPAEGLAQLAQAWQLAALPPSTSMVSNATALSNIAAARLYHRDFPDA